MRVVFRTKPRIAFSLHSHEQKAMAARTSHDPWHCTKLVHLTTAQILAAAVAPQVVRQRFLTVPNPVSARRHKPANKRIPT